MHRVREQLETICREKDTRLCVSADVTTSKELLRIADICGPYVCVMKTHMDIIADFNYETTIRPLVKLSELHHFLIFEDRKFADIGNTVAEQFGGGIFRIVEWAHITNAHSLPGDGIVDGLRSVVTKRGLENRALLLLAEMSSRGNLCKGEYSTETVAMAARHKDFCIGFIGQHRLDGMNKDSVLMTPGVALDAGGGKLGQQYRTPKDAISGGSDIIIVGRGITGSKDMVDACKRYRDAAK